MTETLCCTHATIKSSSPGLSNSGPLSLRVCDAEARVECWGMRVVECGLYVDGRARERVERRSGVDVGGEEVLGGEDAGCGVP